MTKRPTILFIALCLCLTSFGQIKKAKKEMHLFNYSKAISILEKTTGKGTSAEKLEAAVLLAECYRKQNDAFNAKAWYARALEQGSMEPGNYYYYAQSLRTCGDYTLAKKMFLRFDSLANGDSRGKTYAAFCDSSVAWNALPPGFEVKNAQALNSKQSDFGPVFYENGVLFTSDRVITKEESRIYGWTGNNYLHLFSANPQYLDDFYSEYSKPRLSPGYFNQDYHDGPASFNKDQNLVFINRTIVIKDKGKKEDGNLRTHLLKLFYATKKNNKWSVPEPFFLNSNDYSIGHPALSPDGKTLYFVSDMNGGKGGTDIYQCEFINGKWSDPVNLGNEINTFGNEMFPFVADNGDLYFASDGLPGYGGLDIFVTRKTDGKWSRPVNLGKPINSSFDDFALAIDKADKTGLFSSNRPGGLGSDDIYCFKRIQLPPPVVVPPPVFATGCVKEKSTLAPIPGATVFLVNEQTGQALVIRTNANGCFKTPVIKGIPYIIKAVQPTYIADCYSFSFDPQNPQNELAIPRDLLLDKLRVNEIFKLENIYYDFDKSFIRPDAHPPLDNLVKFLRENPVRVELGSHTDSRGSDEYNLKLSQRRADAAVEYIISQGISHDRITARGYGETMLVNQCRNGVKCTDAEHQANRRTEFKILGFVEPAANDPFDPGRFRDGETLDIRFMPGGFFNNCPVQK